MSLEQQLRGESLSGDQSHRELPPRKPVLKLKRDRMALSSTVIYYVSIPKQPLELRKAATPNPKPSSSNST